ncbi:MAG TPA: FIST N-terminal domain-containing protein [Paracoccaceae bacterium]|nr:FIST N-terminal domain-containing protein [Paracoccaceae bacterium]
MTNLKATLQAWAEASSVVRGTHVSARAPDAIDRIHAALGTGPLAAVMMFVSPEADATEVAAQASARFPGTPVLGCTTAGELSFDGYSEGEIVAVGFPSDHFLTESLLIDDLTDLHPEALVSEMIRLRQRLGSARPDWEGEFAFLLVDGMSRREDELMAALATGLGPVRLFGGSAGDGLRFGETFVLHNGKALKNAAVLTFVRTACPVRVFNLDHLLPTGLRMVVTEADPAERIVRQINAEPAAREYARLLGKDPDQLTTFTFAAHPVVVRIGGRHHVRSIQRMAANGDLVFFSAIDEGLVLTLAEPMHMANHLDAELSKLSEGGVPAAILACDCILRRIEAEEKQMFGQVSAILKKHRVLGFSTYGEQLGTVHVNQTMTGIAIYPPAGHDR